MAGRQQSVLQILILREFRIQAFVNNDLSQAVPVMVIIISDASAQILDLAHVVRIENLLCNFGIVEAKGFLVHHVLLHGAEGNPICTESGGIPVT